MINPFLPSKKPISVNFTYPADSGRVLDVLLCALFLIKLWAISFSQLQKPSRLFGTRGRWSRLSQMLASSKSQTEYTMLTDYSLCSLPARCSLGAGGCPLWPNIPFNQMRSYLRIKIRFFQIFFIPYCQTT